MNCPKCGYQQVDGLKDCLKCGIYFSKYEKAHKRLKQSAITHEPNLFFEMKEANNPMYRIGRLLLLLCVAWMSWSLIFSPIEYWQGNAASRSFLHNINLPFHEAGHLIFRPFGRFITSMGGSLGQLLMPLICFVVLLWKTRDAFGAAVSLWWLGESFLDLVAYMDDATTLSMPLLGGNEGKFSPYGFHDWEFILTESGLIEKARELANATHILGSALMGIAMLWMLMLLTQKNNGQ